MCGGRHSTKIRRAIERRERAMPMTEEIKILRNGLAIILEHIADEDQGQQSQLNKIYETAMTALADATSANCPLKQLTLESGCFYENGHGDHIGPMEERAPGVWLDKHGAVYHPNGVQWNHVSESAGNIVKKIGQ